MEVVFSGGAAIITFTICGLVAVACAVGFRLLIKARDTHRALAASATRIERIEGPVNAKTLSQIKLALPDSPLFRQQWEEFCESIVELPDGRVENSIPFSEFVKDDAFLAGIGGKVIRFPVIHYLASASTSLGILGTFLGITLSLSNLDPEDADIGPMIAGLSSAFITSIVGIVGSMFLNLFGGHREAQLLADLHRVQEAVERLIPRVTAEKLLAISVVKLEEIRKAEDESRLNLGTIANDLVDALASQFEASMGRVLVPQLEAMTKAVELQVAQVAEAGTAEARRFTEEMVSQISGALGDSLDEMSKRVETASENLNRVAASFTGILDKAASTAESQNQLLEHSTAALLAAQERTTEVSTQLESIAKLTEYLSGVLSLLGQHQQATEQTLASQLALQKDASESAYTMSHAISGAAASYQESAQYMASAVQSTTEWADVTTRGIESFGTAIRGAIEGSLNNYDRSLNQAVMALGNVLGQLEATAEDLLGASTQLPPSN